MATRRERQQRRKRHQAPPQAQAPRQERRRGLDALYHDKYKTLLLIPFIILFLALLQLGFQYATTGDILQKGVSLSGGLTLTLPVEGQEVTVDEVERLLREARPDTEFIIRGLSEFGTLQGISVEVAAETGDEAQLEALERELVAILSERLPGVEDRYSVEVIGPSLGETFFRQTLTAVLIAFMLMGLVVFFYFGTSAKAKAAAVALSLLAYLLFGASGALWQSILLVACGLALVALYAWFSPPSAAVILAAFSDIVVTLAVVNLLGVKVSTAGVAAFLMLIGYSVDTDILLSTRVLRHRKGGVYESIISSLKTGILMSLTSFIAALIGFLVSQSATIKQIMLIIMIGLLVDIIFTWLQNAGIIRMYAERRGMA